MNIYIMFILLYTLHNKMKRWKLCCGKIVVNHREAAIVNKEEQKWEIKRSMGNYLLHLMIW